MATEQFVKLPADVVAGSQKPDIINLIGIVTRFALPGQLAVNSIERDLEARFTSATIGLSDALSWFDQMNIKYRQLTNGDTELLRQQLQTGNDANSLQLIEIGNANKLHEWAEGITLEAGLPQGGTFARTLWPRPEPCLLLRYDYLDKEPGGHYLASLPAYSKRPITLSWPSLVDAGIGACVEIPVPAKMIEADALLDDLQAIEQAIAAATVRLQLVQQSLHNH